MESVFSLKMLAAFVLVLLVSSGNEGRVLTKCELKAQLEAAQFQVIKGNSVTVEDLIARFVCRVENSSEFNTSLITSIRLNGDEFRPPLQSSPQLKAEDLLAKENDNEKMVEEHIIPVQPRRRPETSVTEAKIISEARRGGKDLLWTWRRGLFPNKPPTDASGSHSEESSEEGSSGDSSGEGLDDVITWNLFGILQLGDQVACDSGSNRTLNLCGLDCSALIDDDITDDVICLKTLAESQGKLNGFSPQKKVFAKMMAMLLSKECRSVIPSEYFAECDELSGVSMEEASTSDLHH